ncbi:hypothetical protein KP509_29G074500 [Ceratopteris richardii]|uniref:J domain-containing protein n=1 Tax=Ceratopteris richardii TaxID=49495 RepID=A0A8T2RA54_CERRI|nr:hypothetical protein KP509_29G074500 [Ceratopteris richardii]
MSVGVDHYAVLQLHKSASVDEIRRAYRRLAMKWHPDNHPGESRDSAFSRFNNISNAYQVLNDPERRKLYEEGGGSLNTDFRDSRDVFKEVFGFSSPLDIHAAEAGGIQGALEKVFVSALEMTSKPEVTCKAPAVERPLVCSLDELYNGCTRKVKISTNQIDSSGRSIPIEEFLTIEVKPGWRTGMKITFPGKGNNKAGMLPSDVVFVIEEKPHKVFKRRGNDLMMVARVPLVDALTGYTAHVETLDGRILTVPCVDVLHPASEVIVSNEGMPIVFPSNEEKPAHQLNNGSPCIQNPVNGAERERTKGNLLLHFDIVFPTQLSTQQKTAVRHALLEMK